MKTGTDGVGPSGVVYLKNTPAALFMTNKWCCYYAVAASLEGVNSHPLIWSAIQHCKAMGLKRFELGEKLNGSEKARNISYFKAGFGATLEKRVVKC